MDTFGASELRRLTSSDHGTCISMFMPTHAAGRDGQQDALRLKNLTATAERELLERGMRSPEVRKILQPVRDLPGEPSFWEKRSQGLALFVADGVFDRFRVPLPLDETVVVNQRFQVKPLLPLLNSAAQFYVLAFSQNRVRLFEGDHSGCREVIVPGLPENMQKSLNYDQISRSPQSHAGQRGNDHGKQGVVFHGQGDEGEIAKEDLAKYFRLIDTALHPVLRNKQTPMILAAVQYLLPIFRDASSYPHIAREELPGNPDHASEQDLHGRAWPIVAGWNDMQLADAAARYQQLAGTGKTVDDLHRILPAASQGQIETLFVERGAHRWGWFDAQTSQVRLNGFAPKGTDDDLLDLAAVQTLLNRGTVYSVENERCPSPPICAVLRY
jgi:hypothetical protein